MKKLPTWLNAAALGLLLSVLGLAGCGVDETPEAKGEQHAIDAPMIAQPEMKTGIQANLPDIGEPVEELMIFDDQIGTGALAERGKILKVHYHGWLYDINSSDHKGKLFDRSKIRGPFAFKLGAGRVIRGWDHGLLGMRQGGKRTLFIPPELGYADRGERRAGIPPGATLVFEIELLEVL